MTDHEWFLGAPQKGHPNGVPSLSFGLHVCFHFPPQFGHQNGVKNEAKNEARIIPYDFEYKTIIRIPTAL